MQRTRWVWLALLIAAGCGDDGDPMDAGPGGGMDAGPPVGEDAGMRRDAQSSLPDAGPVFDAGEDGGPGPDGGGDAGVLTAASCFDGNFVNATSVGPDYDQFMPTVGTHCRGTNHQDITGVERVVFLGDSVTVGSPPTTSMDFYRSELADMLASRFGISPPNAIWRTANPFDGMAGTRESGDFASCAEWGARTDDLMRDGSQVMDCLPMSERDKRTLVVITAGGNDVANIAEAGADGSATVPELWMQTMEFVQLMRDTVEWITAPGRFPNGVYVVFANMFEFTDGTGDTTSCPAAQLAGIGAPWPDPTALRDMVVWANEQYMRIAVDTGTDMIFMLEEFCGHGHANDDPMAPCYRGPGAARWFDLTCIHPNPTGHGEIANMFMSVVSE